MSLALDQTDPSQDTVLECATAASTLYAESRDYFINCELGRRVDQRRTRTLLYRSFAVSVPLLRAL